MTAPRAVVLRVARIWVAGRPHEAWEAWMAAGLSRQGFEQLNRELLKRAHARYLRKIAAYRRKGRETVH